MIIQVFFVNALSSSLFVSISIIIEDPFGEGIRLLATSLPTRSTLFIQILIVGTPFLYVAHFQVDLHFLILLLPICDETSSKTRA